MAALEVHGHVAGRESIAVAAHHLHRAVDVHLLRVEIVPPLVGGDEQRPLLQVEASEHSADVDHRDVRAGLDGAIGDDRELLPLVVGAGVMRLLHSQLLGRIRDLLLVEDEADVALLAERGDGEDRDQRPDGTWKQDLGPSHQPVVGASRNRPTVLALGAPDARISHAAAQPSWAKMSCSAQPAMSSSARAGRKSKQACAKATRSSRSSRSSSFSLSAWRKRTSLAAYSRCASLSSAA